MRILLVNWQDLENPQAGGAEIHLHEIFGRLAAMGHEVRLLCGGWPGCPARAKIDGVDVFRVGTRHTFPFFAHRYYKEHLTGWADVLVEDINKVPLYTTRWNAKSRVALVPHLFGSTAFQELAAPLAAAVWSAERPLGRAYRRVPFQAISESTADDLVGRGIPRGSIAVIYPGVDTVSYTPNAAERSPTPVFAYLGRLKKYKGVHLVIRAFAEMKVPNALLEIAGAGDYRPKLEALAASLDLGEGEVSWAHLRNREAALLRRAWALAFASPKEGGASRISKRQHAPRRGRVQSTGIRESVRTARRIPHSARRRAAMGGHARLAESPGLVASLGITARVRADLYVGACRGRPSGIC